MARGQEGRTTRRTGRQIVPGYRERSSQPVLVHCFAGIHRTGTTCALFRVARQGWSADQAIVEMQSYGFKSGKAAGPAHFI
ncbi:protein-tyrosine phosphatase family protein [Gemmata massiliana]|uniref:protein-tyrosine phosphatase family protein n=1 Tax=Gemmata massiliana TaxID=1210884 RepID=UPI0036F330E2